MGLLLFTGNRAFDPNYIPSISALRFFWQICTLLLVVIQPFFCFPTRIDFRSSLSLFPSRYLSRLHDLEFQVQQCTGAANWLSFSFWIQSMIKPCSRTGACAPHKPIKWEIIRVRCCSSWSFCCTSFLFLAPLNVLCAPGVSMLVLPNWMYGHV